MADLQSALLARLTDDAAVSAIVSDEIYWSNVPQGTALPYVRLQTISDPRPQHLQGYRASRTVRVQVDVFASSYSQARAGSNAIIELMAQPTNFGGVNFGRATAQGPIDGGEDTPNGFIHRLRTDLLAEHSIA